jgi:hypothetical protein
MVARPAAPDAQFVIRFTRRGDGWLVVSVAAVLAYWLTTSGGAHWQGP